MIYKSQARVYLDIMHNLEHRLRVILRELQSPFDFAPAQRSLPPPRFVGRSCLGHSACPGTLSTCNYTQTLCFTHPNEPAGDTATLHCKHIDYLHILK